VECDTVSIGKAVLSKEFSTGVIWSWFSSFTKIKTSARSFSEILVKIYQTKKRHVSEYSVLDRHIHTA
jgi:hypothetical protein